MDFNFTYTTRPNLKLSPENIRLGLVVKGQYLALGIIVGLGMTLEYTSFTISSLIPSEGGSFPNHRSSFEDGNDDEGWTILGEADPYVITKAQEAYQESYAATSIESVMMMPAPEKVTVVERYFEGSPQYPESFRRINDNVLIHRRMLLVGPKDKLDILDEAYQMENSFY